MSFTIVEDGHISSPLNYRATGVSAGLKHGSKARDLGLVYSQDPATAAAMFSTNLVQAAPIFFNHAILSRNRTNLRAVLINSGQANTATGQQGLNDAVECAKLVADELEVPRDGVLLLSTGVIGEPLPMERMRSGIIRAVSELDSGGGRRAATAMLTTDSRPKDRAYHLKLRDGRKATVAGMIKGTRRVHPRLATTLCVITTDLPIEEHILARSLQQSVEHSLHHLSIDGDSSPNDAVIVLANGAVGGATITDPSSWELGAWQETLDALLANLTQQMLRDAAGTGKIVRVVVRGAPDDTVAYRLAERVAHSYNVRVSLRHSQPDWGAILAVIGASTDLKLEGVELYIADLLLMADGVPAAFDKNQALQLFGNPEIELIIDLHQGTGLSDVWTCIWPEEDV